MGQGIGFKDDDGSYGFKLTDDGKVILGNTSDDVIQVTGTLDVNGTLLVDHYIKHSGDENTLINFADDKIILKTGGKAMVTIEEKGSAPHEVTINDGGNNVDFVVKGNGSNEGNPLFACDASTGRVGINGVGSPAYELDVDGTVQATTFQVGSADTRIYASADAVEDLYIEADDDIYLRPDDDLYIAAGTSNWAHFDGGNSRLGINKSDPSTTLDVNGTIHATEISASVEVSASAFYSEAIHTDGDSIYVDIIRRKSDSSTSTKIRLRDEAVKIHAGNVNQEVLKVEDGLVAVTGNISGSGFYGDVHADNIYAATTSAPSSASDTGTAGEIRWDSNYIYVCVTANTWKRVGLSSW